MLGVDNLIVTNAAGSLSPDFRPGDLMLIRDHVKLVTDSPLRGANIDEFGPRFSDMSDPYSKEIRDLARRCSASLGLELKEWVYCYMPGPSYETASEVRMLGMLGEQGAGEQAPVAPALDAEPFARGVALGDEELARRREVVPHREEDEDVGLQR
mgnify:CR=1 FL=1